MLDYLKMANKIIIILCIIFLTSVCFAQTSDIEEKFKEENTIVEKIWEDITLYINTSNICFEATKECRSMYQLYVDHISKLVRDKGWTKEQYYIEMQLMIHKLSGKRAVYMILYIKSKVKDGYYIKEWTIPEKDKNYVRRKEL